MHLVYKALEKHTIPASLPPELMRSKPPGIPPAPVAMQTAQPLLNNKVNYVNIVMIAKQRTNYIDRKSYI
jgi:hypothetical protein